jgi:hypothetical protein
MGAVVSKSMSRDKAMPRAIADEPPGPQSHQRAMRGFRLSLIIVIVAASCYVAYGLGQLWAEWRAATQPRSARQSAAVNLTSMPAVLPLAGQWSFAELDWNLRSSVVEPGEVAARFDALGSSSAQVGLEQLPDVSQELLDLATSFQIRPIERGGNQVYRIDRPDLRLQLIVRSVAGHRKAVALGAAYPQGPDEWRLLEFSPRGSTGSTVATAPFLLPLPAGAKRSGGRFADDGRVLLELISLESNADQLISRWTGAGWEVRPAGLGGPDEFRYLCARGEDVVYAWSADQCDSIQNLMLVRTPTGADTKVEMIDDELAGADR